MESKQASIEFSNTWKSPKATHKDRIFYPKINYWRDQFPKGFDHGWEFMEAGESKTQHFPAGELVVPWSEKKVYSTFASRVKTHYDNDSPIVYSAGRHYSRGLLFGLGFISTDRNFFRVISYQDRKLVLDLNHPLAKYDLKLTGKIVETLGNRDERGGQCTDIAEAMTSEGIGMQAALEKIPTEFYQDHPFSRKNESTDVEFYEPDRFVHHVDRVASENISKIYQTDIRQGMKVLDLMSSWVSHIPDTAKDIEITGIGLNQAEMDKNSLLANRLVHDLNQSPTLPLPDNYFDLAVCSLSVEYLTQPEQVFTEVARVLKPGASFIVTFSDRWYPEKVIRIWEMLNPFERMGLVLDYFESTKCFESLHTESLRGYFRPMDDDYIKVRSESDPIFAVKGKVKI